MTTNWEKRLNEVSPVLGLRYIRLTLQVQEELEMVVVVVVALRVSKSFAKMVEIFVGCCVVVERMICWKRCRFSTLLLRLSRDLSHLQQRTRQNGIIVHFFSHLATKFPSLHSFASTLFAESFSRSRTQIHTQIVTVKVPLLLRFSDFMHKAPFRRVREWSKSEKEREKEKLLSA